MSSDESSKLVDFFAARDDAPTPYEFNPRTSSDYLQTASLEHPKRLDDALRIITDNDYCVKCHLVGDFTPPGSDRTMGPQLDRVNERLRCDYVHRWVGDPKRILPYTGMPVNIPFDKPVKQTLFPGTQRTATERRRRFTDELGSIHQGAFHDQGVNQTTGAGRQPHRPPGLNNNRNSSQESRFATRNTGFTHMSPQSRKVFGRVLFSALCLALTSSIAAAADEWGNLKGRFVFDGKAPTPEALNVSQRAALLAAADDCR